MKPIGREVGKGGRPANLIAGTCGIGGEPNNGGGTGGGGGISYEILYGCIEKKEG